MAHQYFVALNLDQHSAESGVRILPTSDDPVELTKIMPLNRRSTIHIIAGLVPPSVLDNPVRKQRSGARVLLPSSRRVRRGAR
jgi:hypothetical protein